MRTFIICGCVFLNGLLIAQGKPLDAFVEVSVFEAQNKHYAEIFAYILGNTVRSDTNDAGSVLCTYFLYQDSTIVAGDKYNLISSSEGSGNDFMDLHRHFLLPGEYTLKFSFVDNLDSTNNLQIEKSFRIDDPQLLARQSDLQLLASAEQTRTRDVWARHGRRCVPLPFDYYHKSFDQLIMYNELYGMEDAVDDDFFVRFAIYPEGTPDRMLLKSHKRLTPGAMIPLFHNFDISGLSSGSYVASLDVYARDQTLLSRAEHAFIRSNPKADEEWIARRPEFYDQSFVQNMDADSVRYVLKSLAPKVSPVEVEVLNYLIAKGELDNQKRFIHRFWLETAPLDPEGAFKAYMQVANYVNRQYASGLGYGFETDRGHIYMKYGVPDDLVAVEDEPSAPPYEIWIYYDFPVTSQSDVKFLFYDPTLSNHFQLLHSTAEGEIQNARWEQELYRDAMTESGPGDLIDARSVSDNFHRSARQYFKDY